MGTEIITDYETVEKEKTVYVCDHCNTVYEDEREMHTVRFYEHGDGGGPQKEQLLCENCCGLTDALQVEAQRERYSEIIHSAFEKLNWVTRLIWSLVGVALGAWTMLLWGVTITAWGTSYTIVDDVHIFDVLYAFITFAVVYCVSVIGVGILLETYYTDDN